MINSNEKIERAHRKAQNLALEANRLIHINFGTKHVLNEETGKYQSVDTVSAGIRRALIEIWRFIKSIS